MSNSLHENPTPAPIEPASSQRVEQTRGQNRPYPVLTLPNEIVSEIFVHYLPPYPECPPFTGPDSPSHLTQICGKWREIALSTPQLWRAIEFPLGPKPLAEADISDFQAYLARSRSCPLSLTIIEDAYTYQGQRGRDPGAVRRPMPECWALKILKAALQHSARLEFLTIHLYASAPFLQFDSSFPLLRLVELRLPVEFDSQTPEVLVFRDAPLLRGVILDGFSIPAVVLPWAR
ncbi:hypothetical protein C8R46DRAFT_956127 [Mycena filopes]|nr:hypothetical protein C8R46DRAFT_956127 [Mycena filopes]